MPIKNSPARGLAEIKAWFCSWWHTYKLIDSQPPFVKTLRMAILKWIIHEARIALFLIVVSETRLVSQNWAIPHMGAYVARESAYCVAFCCFTSAVCGAGANSNFRILRVLFACVCFIYILSFSIQTLPVCCRNLLMFVNTLAPDCIVGAMDKSQWNAAVFV